MGDEVIKTGVDELMAYLEGKEKIALIDAAVALKVKADVLQSWVDFLVEEGLLCIEYKFTKPFIYLNKPHEEKVAVIKEGALSWATYRDAYLLKARAKNLPESELQALWKAQALAAVESRKSFFYDEARKRFLSDIDLLWSAYKGEVLKHL